VVTAAPLPTETPREDNAASASVITADRTPRAGESVTLLLSEQSGTTVTRLGGLGATATISLRGSTANQVSVYLDGVPLNFVTGGGVDLGALPLGDVERIEIYRGMSPIAFGASAIGGVVSITTAVPDRNRVDLELGGGSFGTYYGGARGAVRLGRWSIYGGVHALTTNGDFPYVDDKRLNFTTGVEEDARRRNNDLHQVDGVLRSVLNLSEGRRLSAAVLFFDRAQGLPGPGDLGRPTARLGTLRATGILGYESRSAFGPGGKLRATLYGNYHLSHLEDHPPADPMYDTDARDRTYTAGGTTTGRWLPASWLALSGIFDLRYDHFLPTDVQASGSPGIRLFGAAGLESDFWIRALRLNAIPSLRLEVAREERSGRDDFSELLPTAPAQNHVLPIVRLALIEELAGWLSLRANVGRYARLPSLVELYGNTGYLVGNPRLNPESGINADLGPRISWKNGSSSLVWTTAGFASWVDDLIQYVYGSGHARAENVASARILGVETEAHLQLGRHLRTVVAATFTHARDTSPIESQQGKQLPYRPRYRFYVRPEWRAVQITEQTSFGFYADFDVTAANYRDKTNLAPTPMRVLFGAGAFASLPVGFSVRVSGQNLTNSAIYDFSNYPLPGWELYLTLAWSTSSKQQNEEMSP
jgi:outer membrane cobalamin receptor